MKFPFPVKDNQLDDWGLPAQMVSMPVGGGDVWHKAWFMDGTIKEWIMKGVTKCRK